LGEDEKKKKKLKVKIHGKRAPSGVSFFYLWLRSIWLVISFRRSYHEEETLDSVMKGK